MKTRILLLAPVFFIMTSCNSAGDTAKIFNLTTKEGKGPVKDKNFELDFDEIHVAQSIRAEVVKADKERVVVTAPEDILDDVLVEKTGGRVYIHFKPGLRISSRNVAVKIFARDFSKIEATSSADIKVKDRFTQDKTVIKASSSGGISGDFEANDLDIDVSSSGNYSGKIWAVNLESEASSSGEISISGKTKNAEMSASSSGNIDAKQVNAESADLKASSSGSISLSVSERLSATASSSGDINVTGGSSLRTVVKKASSGGSINLR